MMFSYGSGCAASMFVLKFNNDYRKIASRAEFKPRLAQRIRVPAKDYDQIMAKRESMFGKCDYEPQVSTN
jgi:hydroxymethylglutaryl-CoA synthase